MGKSTADSAKSLDQIIQPLDGYRFSMDPVALASLMVLNGEEHVVDIGCGCGIISLLLLQKYPGLKVTGIEIQETLAVCAKQNIRRYRLEKQFSLIVGDIDTPALSRTFKADVVVCNPPYKRKGSGRLNPKAQKALARHEISLNTKKLVRACQEILDKHGVTYVIYPVDRLMDLLVALHCYGFFVHHLILIKTKPDKPAGRVILCAGRQKKRPRVSGPYDINTLQIKTV